MSTGRLTLAGALALALAACGSGNQWGTDSPGSGGGGGGGENEPCPDGVTLRIAGFDPGDVASISLGVGSVTAAYEAGGSIAVTGVPGEVSVYPHPGNLAVLHLTGLETRWGHALVTVSFRHGGAFIVSRQYDAPLDVCTAPLLLHVDPGLVKRDTCEAFLKLDVGRSVVEGPDGYAFLPQYRVVY